MKANYHTHTFRCGHAQGEDREYIEHAIAAGIKILGFSDHCPWDFPDGFASGIRMTPAEIDGYFKSLTDLRDEYRPDIKIYIGFEAEYIPDMTEAQERLLDGYPLDYMIMGQHFNNNEMYSEYMGAPTSDERILNEYVDRLIEGMKTGRYRYIAHPDLLNFTGSDVLYEEQFTRLCEFLKSENIPVEINMLGYIQGRHYPSERFFRIAQKVGNTAVIGFDAHCPEMLGDIGAVRACEKFAESFGLPLVETLTGLD